MHIQNVAYGSAPADQVPGRRETQNPTFDRPLSSQHDKTSTAAQASPSPLFLVAVLPNLILPPNLSTSSTAASRCLSSSLI